MSGEARYSVARIVLAFVLLLALLLGAQALASASAPPGGVSSTGHVIGQTGFAYLGGLRTFGAAVLWNRLDPIFDEYYGQFDKYYQTFLPEVHMVQVLDPQFEQSYYVTSFWLWHSGRIDEAISLAELGLKNNPTSGLLRANLAQLLFSQGKGKVTPRLLQLAREGSGPNVSWSSADDQFEGYGIFRAVFDKAGDKVSVNAIREAQKVLKANGAVPGVSLDSTAAIAPGLK